MAVAKVQHPPVFYQFKMLDSAAGKKLRQKEGIYCRSYSPLPVRLRTVKPAFLASEMESVRGELNVERILRTGFLQAGQWVRGAAETGRRRTNLPPQTAQSPSQSSYSYKGMWGKIPNFKFQIPGKLQVSSSQPEGWKL